MLAGFRKFKPQMEALLKYWEQPPRKDPATGLYVWHDQLQVKGERERETLPFLALPLALCQRLTPLLAAVLLQTGADDLVTSNCPSKYSKCW